MLDCSNLLSTNDYKKNDKIIYKYFQDKYVKRKRKLRLKITKIDEIKNYCLEEIQRNYLMCEKHKKVSSALNYFEKFFLFSFLLPMDVL